ncbi:GNAT family N-acetyltransferase [Kurthia sibirica]|uniref:GNAT family N-acetyltransferase n=1 Tax=Kurthia sibirica TaxID=202750 RepID=A0A2U3ALN6_9BACL|nr:GNAT family N-acetyltransferase [Kurthia sibirica]PWI25448.1 GNAT family N-acetyltransferase [Kurthia sibirica]GEK34972.1 GNAT family acetyltransferase [Kurthia sibirica]
MTKQHLSMREIKIEEMNQFIKLLNYVFQINVSMHKDRLFINAKSKQFREGKAIGWFDGDHLISQILNLPFQVNIHGKIYDMGGITAVGTYPEYSKHGLMHKLIYNSLENMKQEGQTISYLYPYSIPYYRNKGFEIMSDIVEYQMKDTQMPYYDNIEGQVRRVLEDHADVISIYDQYAREKHGSMVRNAIAWNEKFQESYWEEKFEGSDTQLQAAVYYEPETNEPIGYIFYRIMEENFYVDELIYLNNEARKGLWNFINAHKSMVYHVFGKTGGTEAVAFLMQDSEIKQNLSPYFMARIVDMIPFVEQFPFRLDDFSLQIAVEDKIALWNNGTFEISSKAGIVTATKWSDELLENVPQLTIQTLTTMLLGYIRPQYLYSIERIMAPNDQVVELFEELIPNNVPSFIDYF